MRTEITQDMVLEELAKIASSDATDVAEVKRDLVKIRDTKDISPSQKGSIAYSKEDKSGIEVNRYDKLRALEMLGRPPGFFDPKPEDVEDPNDGSRMPSRERWRTYGKKESRVSRFQVLSFQPQTETGPYLVATGIRGEQ